MSAHLVEYVVIRAIKFLLPFIASAVIMFCMRANSGTAESAGVFSVPEELFTAIKQVESSGGKFTGDGKNFVGPYQICQAYLDDSGLGYTLEDMNDDAKARETMIAYWNRYAPRDRPITCEILARIHNGGPRGYLLDRTLQYWERVRSHMI